MNKEEVYISYTWAPKFKGGKNYEKIVASIEKAIENDFKVVIDKKDLKYKGNIKEFEKRLGKGDKIVLVISDKFLKSKHCMYEVLKIKEKGNIYDRIFPVVLDDALIHDSLQAIDYIKYWENEEEKLKNKRKSLKTQENTPMVGKDLANISKYRAIFDNFRGLLSNMNTLNPEIHQETNFSELLNALKGINQKNVKKNKQQKDFESRITLTNRLFERAIGIISKEIHDEKIKADDILEQIKHFHQQCKNKTFQIAVMAIVKSGKSTFLNALLGNEFLPMADIPETSVPVKISHAENPGGVLVHGKNKIEGAAKIKNHIEKINGEKRSKGLQYEVEFNLYAPFKVLLEKKMTGIKFEILDTPGIGEALTEITIGKTIDESNTELIDKISAIIYLLDYTKLKTKEEDLILEKLTTMRPDIFEKIQDRMFFIINKIDVTNRHSMEPGHVIDYVFNLVSAKMPNVLRQHFLVLSASEALLARLILNGSPTPEVKHDFGKIAFGKNTAIRNDSEYTNAAPDILHSSGIITVETNIINYIFENRSRIFIEGLQDNLKRLLKEFKNKFVITAEGTLSKTVKEIDDLELKIEEAKKKQTSIQEEADKFEEEIKEWIENEFKGFEKVTLDHIDSAFNADKAEEKQSLLGKIIPKWVKNLQKFIKDAEEQTNQASREEVEDIIREIHIQIRNNLINSFTQFKKDLELKVIEKQSLLFTSLKQTINLLAREFETTLKKTLHINLEIIELRINPIDFDRMLSDADLFINRFVKSNSRLENVKKIATVYNPGSWCERGRYEKRHVIQPEWVTKNNINKNGLEIHWKKEIESMNANAIKVTTQLIESNIKSQIKIARNSFNSYVGDYMTTIQEQKVKLSTNTKEEIEQSLKNLKILKENISSIIAELL